MNNRATIYVLQENEEEIRKIAEPLAKSGYDVVGSSCNGGKAVDDILLLKPDFVVAELIRGETNALQVIRETKHLHNRIVLTSFDVPSKIINAALKEGASYFMSKPFNVTSFMSFVDDFTNRPTAVPECLQMHFATRQDAIDDLTLDERISEIFLTIGIPPHIRGYAYLKEGIKLVVRKPWLMNNITGELYPEVAMKFLSTPSKVERGMRHALTVAWNKNRIACINALFGIHAYGNEEKPTNSEFIALIADRLLFESKHNLIDPKGKGKKS